MKKVAAKKAKPWTDGDPPPKDPIVAVVHVEGITYQRMFVLCGKERCRKGCAGGRASHGPYWYAKHWLAPRGKAALDGKPGRTKTVYVGKHLPNLIDLADRPEMQ